MLAIHLLHHEGTPDAEEESREAHLGEHLRWAPSFAQRVVRSAEEEELIRRQAGGRLLLTARGREAAQAAMTV
jgi:manganese/zinc/iron transport system permease protein